MVSIEKVIVNNKGYYRLVHSIRKDKKITHRTKYIGKKLPPKYIIDKMKLDFLKNIDKLYKYLNKDEVKRIENKKEEYNKEIKKLSLLNRDKKLKEFLIRFTYDSSKLAGINITLRQTSLILKDGIIPKDFKNVRTIKELENHERGVVAITKYKGKFTLSFIKKLHRILFSGVDDIIAGKIRSELKRNVKIAGTSFVPPRWNMLDRELNIFFMWYSSENKKLHPLELAALIHLKLISIQPFVDGNSRLARLLMNWILWKKKYPMIDIPIIDLEEYYNVLDKYQIEKNEKAFIKYITKKYLES